MYFKKVRIVVLSLMLLASVNSYAQIAVNFSPAINGLTLDGLSFASISNSTTTTLLGFLRITVKNSSGVIVFSLKTASMLIKPGNSLIDQMAFANGLYSFGNTNEGYYLRQSRRFLEGDYEYCYEVNLIDNKTSNISDYYENCFQQHIQPFTPLILISPDDGDKICDIRPAFNWQPPSPLMPDMKFRFQLTEVKARQTEAEALIYNVPLVYQENLHNNLLLYPASAPNLVEGKKYAWQVTAYTTGIIITKSEIWTFTAGCDSIKKKEAGEGYRELKQGGNGGYYITQRGFLRFSFNNFYQSGKLNYSIESLSAPGITIKHLPVLELKPGINKYDLDLSDNRSFKKDEEYLLKVYLPSSEILTLRFIYKQEEAK